MDLASCTNSYTSKAAPVIPSSHINTFTYIICISPFEGYFRVFRCFDSDIQWYCPQARLSTATKIEQLTKRVFGSILSCSRTRCPTSVGRRKALNSLKNRIVRWWDSLDQQAQFGAMILAALIFIFTFVPALWYIDQHLASLPKPPAVEPIYTDGGH